MTNRDWARDSVTIAEEGKTSSPEEILAEPLRSEQPLDALPVADRAFFRVLHGLDPSWEDIQYIANVTGRSPHEAAQLIQAVYQKNTRRQVDCIQLMEKVASAYSRLTELAAEEQKLQEQQHVLAYQRPVDKVE